jgi:hypothetical protein
MPRSFDFAQDDMKKPARDDMKGRPLNRTNAEASQWQALLDALLRLPESSFQFLLAITRDISMTIVTITCYYWPVMLTRAGKGQ